MIFATVVISERGLPATAKPIRLYQRFKRLRGALVKGSASHGFDVTFALGRSKEHRELNQWPQWSSCLDSVTSTRDRLRQTSGV